MGEVDQQKIGNRILPFLYPYTLVLAPRLEFFHIHDLSCETPVTIGTMERMVTWSPVFATDESFRNSKTSTC